MTITLSHPDYCDLMEAAAPDISMDDEVEWIAPYPSRLGEGQEHYMGLRDGVELRIERLYLYDTLVLQHDERPHPVEYSFEYRQASDKRQRCYCLYGSGLAPRELWQVPGGQQIVRLNVHIEPEIFQQWMGQDEFCPLVQALMRSHDQQYLERSGSPTPIMDMAVQQILCCPFQGLTQRLYLESKVWELMALLIDELACSPTLASSSQTRKPEDIERIHDASRLLRQQMMDPPSLMALARAVGINDHKLKVGFRQVFGTTAFGYLHQQRLERSRQLLEAGDMSVTQAARAVGFANRGHFAAAFRRQFGVNPGVYARGQRQGGRIMLGR